MFVLVVRRWGRQLDSRAGVLLLSIGLLYYPRGVMMWRMILPGGAIAILSSGLFSRALCPPFFAESLSVGS